MLVIASHLLLGLVGPRPPEHPLTDQVKSLAPPSNRIEFDLNNNLVRNQYSLTLLALSAL